jgi:H+/Cl- antiporter ClcA
MESASGAVSYVWALFPSLVASAVGTAVFVLLSGAFFGNLIVFPDFMPKLTDLLWAVPLALAGAAAGGVFIVIFRWLRRIMEPLRKRVVLRGLLGGLGMGIAGALLPLTLFSGEYEAIEVIDTAAEIGVAMLIVLAVVKVFITSLVLVTGWKGGYIFPTMFAGVALGMALHLIFPSIPLRPEKPSERVVRSSSFIRSESHVPKPPQASASGASGPRLPPAISDTKAVTTMPGAWR